MSSLDQILHLFANGMAPVADGNGWLVTCALCSSVDLRIVQRPKTISVLCRKGCKTAEVLAKKGLKLADLKQSANGAHAPANAPTGPPPPPQTSQAPQPHQPRPP